MPAGDEIFSVKPTPSDLQAQLGRAGLPAVLGRAVLSGDDPRIDPAGMLPPGLHDIAGETAADQAAALAFALAAAAAAARRKARPALVCHVQASAFEGGGLYGPGLASLGLDPRAFIVVSAADERDLLWSAEEALGCGDIAALVLRLPARARKYGFAASRRLQLRAAASGTPACVARAGPERGAVAAETLWRVSPAAPASSEYASKRILGTARWRVALERARTSRPRTWVMAWDDETLRLDLADAMGDGPLLSRAS